MPIRPVPMNALNVPQALSQGNQLATQQANLMNVGQQMAQRNALAPIKMEREQLATDAAKQEYMIRQLNMASPENYRSIRQDLIGKGMPGQNLPESYDENYINAVLGRKPAKQEPGFTLSPGQARFDPTGRQIAAVPKETAPPADVDPMAPWAKIQDPKKRDEAMIRFGAITDKKIEKMTEDAQSAINMNNALDRFIQLNETNRTGPEYGVPLLGGMMGAGRSAFDPEFQEMKSISDRLTPQMRQGMPGAASDRDVAMFRGATVGTEKSPEANANIAQGLKAANQNKIDRANFYQQYATRGHLRGAEQEWNSYLEANPIFDPKAPKGSYQLNESRMSYDEWRAQQEGLSTQGQSPQGGQQAPQQAIQFLMQNNTPEMRQAFQAKYGYLP